MAKTTNVTPGFANREMGNFNTAYNNIIAGRDVSLDDAKAAVKEFVNSIADGSSTSKYTPEQFEALLARFDVLKNSPGMQEALKDMVSTRNADRFTRRYKPFFNLILQGADIGSAISQINTASSAAARLVRPVIPKPSGIDPTLNAEIGRAQGDVFDAARALAPAQQEIAAAYNQSDVADRAISGGQSGVYGARRQKAAVERMRAGLALPAMADEVKRREQQRLAQLLGMRQNAALQNDQLRLMGTRMATDQYNSDVTAIGALGAQGQTNLRNTLTTLPDNLLQTAGRFTNSNRPPAISPYAPAVPPPGTYGIAPQVPTGFGPTIDEYKNQFERGIVETTNKARMGSQFLNRYYNPYGEF